MITLESIQGILGWCTVINIGLLVFSSLLVVGFRSSMARLHGKMFALNEEDISRAYFQYLAQFKILVIVFNVTPYIALRLLA